MGHFFNDMENVIIVPRQLLKNWIASSDLVLFYLSFLKKKKKKKFLLIHFIFKKLNTN